MKRKPEVDETEEFFADTITSLLLIRQDELAHKMLKHQARYMMRVAAAGSLSRAAEAPAAYGERRKAVSGRQ